MNAWNKTAIFFITLTWVAAGSAFAQTSRPPKVEDKCKIDVSSVSELRDAYNSVMVLQVNNSGNKTEDAKNRLKKAVSSLTSKPDFGKNQSARDLTLGAALILWLQQPGQPEIARRGDVGYAANPDAKIDLLAAADSSFNLVETTLPECSDRTDIYRQQVWAKLINQAGAYLNANHIDSAETALNRSFVIYRTSPYSYYYKGQIAQRKEDWKGATEAYSKTVALAKPELTAKDSNLANVREYSQFAAAYSQLKVAQALSGDAQKAAFQKAAGLYQAYLKQYPTGTNAQPAQAGLTAALQSSGDKQSLNSVWQAMIDHPDRYSDAQFYEAGTQAFSAEQYPMAVQLMEQGQKANPYLRVGLFNLANAYWKNNQFDKMLPVAQQLTQLDPNNPDNYQLVAIAYQGMEKAAKDVKAQRTLNDSVAHYVTLSEKVPVRVTFSEFSHDSTKHKLVGQFENLGTTPKTAELKVEFLDKAGTVVTTQTTSASLGSKETKPFTIEAEGASIVGFRYAPIK